MRLASTERVELWCDLRDEFLHNYPRGRTIIAVDGLPGSGTEEFADGLSAAFAESDVDTFRASIDDFQVPHAQQESRGADGAVGFSRDRIDEGLLRRVLIDPFRFGGSAGFQLAGFDDERDKPVESRWTTAPEDAVLIVDGAFLLSPALRGAWNWSITVDVPPADALDRIAGLPGAPSPAVYREARERYVGESAPRQVADAIVDNADAERPRRIFADSC